MKKLILRLLGFDNVSIQTLRSEIADLQTTISNLKDEATAIYEKTEQAFIIIKQLNIDKTNELWWEKADLNTKDMEVYMLADRIRKSAAREWVSKHPSLKEVKIFHGGCLNCITPLEDGIGKCLGCKYLGGFDLPDLSRKK